MLGPSRPVRQASTPSTRPKANSAGNCSELEVGDGEERRGDDDGGPRVRARAQASGCRRAERPLGQAPEEDLLGDGRADRHQQEDAATIRPGPWTLSVSCWATSDTSSVAEELEDRPVDQRHEQQLAGQPDGRCPTGTSTQRMRSPRSRDRARCPCAWWPRSGTPMRNAHSGISSTVLEPQRDPGAGCRVADGAADAPTTPDRSRAGQLGASDEGPRSTDVAETPSRRLARTVGPAGRRSGPGGHAGGNSHAGGGSASGAGRLATVPAMTRQCARPGCGEPATATLSLPVRRPARCGSTTWPTSPIRRPTTCAGATPPA